MTLTTAEWKEKMKVWKESTSTSPSGYHLGHSKCLIANHGLKEDSKEAEELDRIRETMIRWQVDLINIAQCIANSICLVACKLESHCTLQILTE